MEASFKVKCELISSHNFWISVFTLICSHTDISFLYILVYLSFHVKQLFLIVVVSFFHVWFTGNLLLFMWVQACFHCQTPLTTCTKFSAVCASVTAICHKTEMGHKRRKAAVAVTWEAGWPIPPTPFCWAAAWHSYNSRLVPHWSIFNAVYFVV